MGNPGILADMPTLETIYDAEYIQELCMFAHGQDKIEALYSIFDILIVVFLGLCTVRYCGLQNLAKIFSACVNLHIQNKWKSSRMG